MHYPGHLREAFGDWLDEGCPQLATVEVDYEPQTWPAERLCRRMLNCSDILPGGVYRDVVDRFEFEFERQPMQTYGSVARALLDHVIEPAVIE